MPLLAVVFLLAQQGLPKVPPPMEADEAPTPYACTFAMALRGDQCTFEGQHAAGDARDNSAAAARAGVAACAVEAKHDEALRKTCEREVAEISMGPRCALVSRLADGQGQLTLEAQDCVESLRQAVAHTGRTAPLANECCACLADSKCGVPQNQCRKELADLTPGAELKTCIARSCESACSMHRPDSDPAQDEEPPPAPPPPAKSHRKRDSGYKT